MRRAMHRTAGALAGVTACVLASSCHDSPTAPGVRHAPPIEVGTVASGHLDSETPERRMTLHLSGDREIALVLSVSGGAAATVTLTDSVEHTLLAAVTAGTNGAPAWTPATSTLVPLRAGDYRLRVRRTEGLTLEYRLTASPIDRRPERHAAVIAPGDTVGDETMQTVADVDEFVIRVPAPMLATTFLENGGGSGQAIDAVVLDSVGGAMLAAVTAAGGANTGSLETNASGRLVFPRAGDYRLRVRARLTGSSSTGATFPSPYRFVIEPISVAPEHHAATLAVGDTVSDETLAPRGDVDEYDFDGAAGTELNLFLQGTNGSADSVTTFVIDGEGRRVSGVARSSGSDATLLGQATGRFALARTGSYRVVVLGASDTTGGYRGAYRVYLYPVNRAPESTGAALPADGAVSTEAIDVPGDIDSFSFTTDTTTLVDLELAHASGADDSLRATILDAAGGQRTTVVVAKGEARGSGVVSLAPGSYRIEVAGARTDGRGFTGAYDLRLHRLPGPAPEGVSATVAVGDTVNETLSPLGDEDEFTFRGRRGDHVYLHLQRLPGSGGTFEGVVRLRDTKEVIGRAWSFSDANPLSTTRSVRLTLPTDGEYTVTISPLSGGKDVAEQGPYRFAVLAVPSAPEHVAPDIAVGDSVTDEAMDTPGDIDRFMVHGTPGAEAILAFVGPSGCTVWEVSDTTTRATLSHGMSCGYFQTTPRFTIPSSGVVAAETYEQLFCDQFSGCTESFVANGPYRFHVILVNRAPEVANASIAYGDSVVGHIGADWSKSGEFIDPGDVDEYDFAGIAGDSVEILVRMPNGPWEFSGIRLQVLDRASGAVLADTVSASTSETAAGPFVLPATGHYMIRVVAADDYNADPVYGTGPYAFTLRRIGGP